MKRLVICFDGTWKRAQDENVSNIEKIARTIRSDSDGVQQTVYYVGGVGASYKVDRVLGGSLGLGLGNNLMNAYRFLALNYEAGDKLYVFGFSRGAFTARSLVGMIHKVGLVRSDALIEGPLKDAERLYRQVRGAAAQDGAADRFRRFCHRHVCIPFVGVYDTVEALGPRARFHNIDFLGDAVAMGRQALAIDDRRRVFWPRLWTGEPGLAETGRVRQVWFEGFHSDVGGGVRETGLPDTTLLWMVAEAARQGLVVDRSLLARYVTDYGSDARDHPSMNALYRLVNLGMRTPWATSFGAFSRGWRILEPADSLGVLVDSSASARFDEGAYDRMNLRSWRDSQAPPPRDAEPVLAFPSDDAQAVVGVLRDGSAAATAAGGAVHPCPAVAADECDAS